MCGITGKIYFEDNTVSDQDILAMNEKILHRGPDDGGAYISPDKKVGLGHRRLSIIDLSPLGHQPMSYMDRYWIVFNGEIYNFQEKREILIKEGYSFKSKTDTEIIMALYDKYGKQCLEHLRGMFSFAIYDEKEKTIFCARDRVGKKPFKYYLNNNVFIFASEFKAILTQPEYKKEPDYIAIHHYLTFQYCPAPLTGFKDIKKLEPAHYLFLDLKTKKIEKKRYWNLDYSQKLDLSEKEWKKKIISKLEECVRLRMISDVPLGAFLSGGIDSSAVVGMMSKLSDKPVKTFSIGFKEEKYNELPYAKLIAKKFKTDHTEFIVKPDAIEVLPMLVRQYEEPYADSSALPTYYVSKMTRDYVTVALNGDGGDENFGGYYSYQLGKITSLYNQLSLLHKSIFLPTSKILSKTFKSHLVNKTYKLLKNYSDDPLRQFTNYMCHFNNEMKDSLYTEYFKQLTQNIDSFDILPAIAKESSTDELMDKIFYTDLNSYLSGDLLPKVDIATMSVALEGRSPFLDHELLELSCKIPSNLKIKGLSDKKYILKKSLEGLIPDEILYRPKKGFGIPINDWFRKDLKDYARGKLLSDKAVSRNIFNKKYIKKILDDHAEGKNNYGYYIWNLLALELWFREYFD